MDVGAVKAPTDSEELLMQAVTWPAAINAVDPED
jgi:hypothetical protein